MNPGMMRWKVDPLNPNPFSPVHNALKFSAVLGTMSDLNSMTTRPSFLDSSEADTSIKTRGSGWDAAVAIMHLDIKNSPVVPMAPVDMRNILEMAMILGHKWNNMWVADWLVQRDPAWSQNIWSRDAIVDHL